MVGVVALLVNEVATHKTHRPPHRSATIIAARVVLAYYVDETELADALILLLHRAYA